MKLPAILFICLLFCLAGCKKEEGSSGHPMPWLYGISEEQRLLHDLFREIITDQDDLGQTGSLDTFIIDSIYCQPNHQPANCNYALLQSTGVQLELNTGDKVKLKNGRMQWMNDDQLLEYELLLGSPADFRYFEFGGLENGRIRSCCVYSQVIAIDTVQKVIEFTFPHSEYGFRLRAEE
ncbi:hypothetical protein [Flavilitoribacter nigricans]|uniref:Uncharacterized protein n=1 Tax=Flavilitoribacter nigricans (strain ATCC 23147 / DSM 23189 / NBRC 102662 / NCIMB 1420 / SS-2) TaxID=1122177 RepID=A0A2D0MYJ7_FLAN2|nr:hypothetical protein [Flavilitoribacter nigricans]PHN01362.1 hypothetical protein CRP01_37490 [Flavilitoribacter nigricans DSM 23189 = NBRC 102662]